jgi:hypothetical protein
LPPKPHPKRVYQRRFSFLHIEEVNKYQGYPILDRTFCSSAFIGLAHQGKDIVFRFIIEYIVA